MRITLVAFESYEGRAERELASLREENRQLRELLVAANARPGELERTHAAALAAMEARIGVSDRNTAAARQETIAATQLRDQCVAAERAARVQAEQAGAASMAAVQQELLLSRQQIAAIRAEGAQQASAALAERNAAVAAATQRGDALVAAERQTAQETRVKREKLAQLEAQDTCKMQRFLGEFFMANKETGDVYYSSRVDLIFTSDRVRGNQLPAKLQALQTLINVRLTRPDDSVPLQEEDTKFLEDLDKTVMRAIDACFPDGPSSPIIRPLLLKPRNEILLPLIAARKARIR